MTHWRHWIVFAIKCNETAALILFWWVFPCLFGVFCQAVALHSPASTEAWVGSLLDVINFASAGLFKSRLPEQLSLSLIFWGRIKRYIKGHKKHWTFLSVQWDLYRVKYNNIYLGYSNLAISDFWTEFLIHQRDSTIVAVEGLANNYAEITANPAIGCSKHADPKRNI
jgi:hypothetical protein